MQKDCVMLTTDPTFAYFTYLFYFYLLPVEDKVKDQRWRFSQQQKAVNQVLFYLLTVPISNNVLFSKRNALFCTKISKNAYNLGGV